MDCIFCDIVSGKAPSHKVWEDEGHMAFLSIYPNTPGVTVVVTKKHYPSYVYQLPDAVFYGLLGASRKVALLLDEKLEGVGRTGLVAEGFGVNHAHVKLFPMHGTKMNEWQSINSNVDKYFEKYEGYLSTHNGKREDDEVLAQTARKIKN